MPDVLIVVSDLIFSTRIRATAEAAGRSCLVVSSTPALVATLAEKTPDLALVDMGLTGLSAAEAIRTIKTRSSTTRVIAFFSHVQVELMTQALGAGADDAWARSRFVHELPGLMTRDAHGCGSSP